MSAQNILDEYYPPLSKYKKRVERNNELTDEEVSVLYKFVDNFEEQEEKFDWINEIDSIIPIIKRFQSTDVVSVTTNKAGTIPKSPKATPFLITQVLFYLGVACSFYEKDGKPLAPASKILEVLKDKGLNLSHNFYTKLNLNSYVEMLKYRQPEMLFKYNGAKHKELGVALKNLVYQAGAYNTFVDVFGGSGAASVAFPRRRNTKYYYNDIDKDLTNLFEILVDEKKHLKLIEYLGYLQEDLKGERDWEEDLVNTADYLENLNLNEEAQKFYIKLWNKKKKDKDNLQNISDILDADIPDITKSNYYTEIRKQRLVGDLIIEADLNVDFNSIIDFMSKLHDIVIKNKENYRGSDDFLKVVFENSFKVPLSSFLIQSYFENYSNILNFIKLNTINIEIANIIYTDNSNTEILSAVEHQARAKQLRFYEWYAYFCNIRSGSTTYSDETLLGVATVFYYSFVTNGSADISDILRNYIDTNEIYADGSQKSDGLQTFIEKDFSVIIKNLYSKMKKNDKLLAKRQSNSDKSLDTRTVIETKNCFELLDIYSKEDKTLIYSDSPYLNTTGYKAGIFTKEDMDKLIKALFSSNNKFIFSCRACLSKQRGDDLTKVRKGNQELLEWLFKKFEGNELWVCTVGVDFWKQVRNNDITEIFITNYEIHSFSSFEYPDIKFKVYSYKDFIDELLKNINI